MCCSQALSRRASHLHFQKQDSKSEAFQGCISLVKFPDPKLDSLDYQVSRINFQIELGNITLTNDELDFLQSSCPYLGKPYLDFLRKLRLNPQEQVVTSFTSDDGSSGNDAVGTLNLTVKGLWVETILYEVPLMALISEAYFRFIDTEWTYDGQEDKAYAKGMKLLEAGCHFSDFGTRRRRDYQAQALVLRGLMKAKEQGERLGLSGRITGTSNVDLARRYGIPPQGTMAHEWIMGVAAITGDYKTSTSQALDYWLKCFGEKVLNISLTDTFGTPAFLRGFNQLVPDSANKKTFAEVFSGVRQDSGDPVQFVKIMKDFYEKLGITEKKTIIFSDALNVERCLEYQKIGEEAGFNCWFGIGTSLTNDFIKKNGEKSSPLNIVIKLSSAAGNPAVKLSDDVGKNTGDPATVTKVKEELGYIEIGSHR